ncbi:MAG: DNA primase [Clostridia bacterium]|nr:DNA primase [Clostridia bacterium]
MIPREYIEEVKNRCDIVQHIGTYVNLKRAGSNYVGLCPFHSEKTPSFTVFPTEGNFYCFGCGAGGSVITFVQRMENLDFQEAVRMLADRSGIRIPEDISQYQAKKTISRDRLFKMNKDAAIFFHDMLMSPDGAEGLNYFKNIRKLSHATIQHFGLGFAPRNPSIFLNYMHDKGYTDWELTEGFFTKRSQTNGSIYVMFRNRAMFPIIDTSGNVIAFGGRVMDHSEPKYLNSSDTVVFNKRKNLYALNFAKNSGQDTMILCEGYMDVIAMHAAGFTNAVATLGTAITPDHARLLTRYCKRCILIYDSDAAGQRADDKAMRLLGEVGLEVRVLKLQGAKDPDEFIKNFGKERFRQALDSTKTGFDYKFDKACEGLNLSLPEQKIKATQAVCDLIAGYHSAVEREIYIREAAQRLDVKPETLQSEVVIRVRRASRNEEREREQKARDDALRLRDSVTPEANRNIAGVSAEETLIGLLLLYDDYRNLAAKGNLDLSADDFTTEFGKHAYEEILRLQTEGGFDLALLGESFDSAGMGRLTQCLHRRKQLSNNGIDVLKDSVAALKKAKATSDAQNMDLQTLLESLRRKNGGNTSGGI